MSRQDQYITEVRQQAKALWTAWQALLAAQAEWNALSYATTLAAGDVVNAGVISVPNQGITAAMVGAVVFDTANAIKAVMDAGHATNVAKLL